MIAYVDDYYLMMWLTFLTIPLIAFMRRADLTPGGRMANAARGAKDEAPPLDLPH